MKRLRVFAGPNGSGKSTLHNFLLEKKSFTPYYYINPDEITNNVRHGFVLSEWPIGFSEPELLTYLHNSPFSLKAGLSLAELCNIDKSLLFYTGTNQCISYFGAALSSYLRYKMLNSDSSFSFESVFSHPSKIEELISAKRKQYKIYLYFIATEAPSINTERVNNRVQLGGHDVTSTLVNERYYRCLDLMYEAAQISDRVFFFDNSGNSTQGTFELFAEKKNNSLFLTSDKVPAWFSAYFLEKHKL